MNIIIIINLTNMSFNGEDDVSTIPGAVLAAGNDGTTGRRDFRGKEIQVNSLSTANAMTVPVLGSDHRHLALRMSWNLCVVLVTLIFAVVLVPPIPIITVVGIPGSMG